MDKQELLNKIQREAEEWEKFLGEVGEEQMEQPGATGDWSFKDVVAHLSTWHERSLALLEAAVCNQAPSAFWHGGWDEDDDETVDKTNGWIYEKNRNRPLSDVLEESRQQFRRMENVVKELPDSKLFDANLYEWTEGYPLARLIGFGHFHEEHEPTLRRWLNKVHAT
jgi:hypothetical protein